MVLLRAEVILIFIRLHTLLFPDSMFVTGEEAIGAVDDLVAMGFDRDQAVLALRAAFNNPYRAVEYLTSGMSIPVVDTAPVPMGEPDEMNEYLLFPFPSSVSTFSVEEGDLGGIDFNEFLQAFRQAPNFMDLVCLAFF